MIDLQIKDLEHRQGADGTWYLSRKAVVAKVEDGKEREVTEVRAELSLQGNACQLHSSDSLPLLAASDAYPPAELRAGGPVSAKDAERIGEPCFEIQ
uniref:Uncharacterized protein n=1 Tax=Leersia perrieri TaxID=77586 RepID=A0A0D9XVK4_9ORYZ